MFLEIMEGTEARRREYNEQMKALENTKNINSENEKNSYRNKHLKAEE